MLNAVWPGMARRFLQKWPLSKETAALRKGRAMAIIVHLDKIMKDRKISSAELARKLEITPANISILKTNKGRAIRFSTLDKICRVLQCTPGELLEYTDEEIRF